MLWNGISYLLVKNGQESLLEAFKNGWTKYRNSLVELTEGREWIFQKSSKHRKSQQQWVKHWCSWKTSGAVKQRPNNTGGLPEKNNRGRWVTQTCSRRSQHQRRSIEPQQLSFPLQMCPYVGLGMVFFCIGGPFLLHCHEDSTRSKGDQFCIDLPFWWQLWSLVRWFTSENMVIFQSYFELPEAILCHQIQPQMDGIWDGNIRGSVGKFVSPNPIAVKSCTFIPEHVEKSSKFCQISYIDLSWASENSQPPTLHLGVSSRCPSIPNFSQRPGTVWGLRQQPGLWNPGVWSHGGYWTKTKFKIFIRGRCAYDSLVSELWGIKSIKSTCSLIQTQHLSPPIPPVGENLICSRSSRLCCCSFTSAIFGLGDSHFTSIIKWMHDHYKKKSQTWKVLENSPIVGWFPPYLSSCTRGGW